MNDLCNLHNTDECGEQAPPLAKEESEEIPFAECDWDWDHNWQVEYEIEKRGE